MKNIKIFFSVLFFVIVCSCETPIDVAVNTSAPKLVVEASINWLKGTTGNEQTIKLSLSTDYYTTTAPAVSGAVVTVSNSTGTTFLFPESAITGEYTCTNFIPSLGETYTLTVFYNGQTLTAVETMEAVPEIDSVQQEVASGIGAGDDRIDIKTYYTDPGATNDFYMYRRKASNHVIPEYEVADDQFFQGNQFFDLYINEDLKPGDTVDISLYGISERYFNYMTLLIGIAGSNGGGPFSTTPPPLRGNIINTTNPSNFVFGYFSVSEVDKAVYTVY